MSRYIYNGPMSAATLKGGTEVILMKGRPVELPDDNSWVKSLVAQGLLTRAPAPKAAPAAKSARARPRPAPRVTAETAAPDADTAGADEKEKK